MINYITKFYPNMSEKIESLKILLRKNIAWHWEEKQESAF